MSVLGHPTWAILTAIITPPPPPKEGEEKKMTRSGVKIFYLFISIKIQDYFIFKMLLYVLYSFRMKNSYAKSQNPPGRKGGRKIIE